MHLSDAEKAMLDGCDGAARARAMDLLLRSGAALGAERLVAVTVVAGTWSSTTPFVQADPERPDDFDAIFSRCDLDNAARVETPRAVVDACQLIHEIDTRHHAAQGFSDAQAAVQRTSERCFGARGVQWSSTCTPDQAGQVPVKGEHLPWMERSAVAGANAVPGARTNAEGREAAGAASITGRIAYLGLHIPENRRAAHRVDVEIPVETMLDRGLTGDALGGAVMEEIPVLAGLALVPRPIWLKHVGAAASSGGAEMYHVPGVTPEADSLEDATGGARARPSDGAAERRAAWEAPHGADRQEDVTFVMPGCPPASAGPMGRIADLPEGRRIHDGVALWVRTPRQIRHLRDESGVTDAIERAGARLMSDGCPAIDRMMPKGTRAIAADSCKQAHCLPAITGHGTWGASLEDCVETALTGRFPGRLQ